MSQRHPQMNIEYKFPEGSPRSSNHPDEFLYRSLHVIAIDCPVLLDLVIVWNESSNGTDGKAFKKFVMRYRDLLGSSDNWKQNPNYREILSDMCPWSWLIHALDIFLNIHKVEMKGLKYSASLCNDMIYFKLAVVSMLYNRSSNYIL